ncbi:uncharacterized protein LOC115422260 [Sphaeramia orbicularis]|uniref:uncharacterized protein LOC115422260 n=1 Tax=Sphaeramia orbicularis TaxID=375764 RepID=UPI00117D5ADD|nr:uncharacterized protein LOC115422260 [Sphaeramia orbicularis]
MEGLKVSLAAAVHRVLQRAGFYLTAFGIFYYHVYLDGDLECTCVSHRRDCKVYLLVPFLVILVVLLWLDRTLHRLWTSVVCSGCRPRLGWALLRRVLEAVFVAHLWIVSVLVDGDWYYCCSESGTCSLLQYPFRPSRDELRNQSRFIGSLLLLTTTIVAAVLSSLPWRKFWPTCGLGFEEMVLDEADDVVPQTLRKAARDHLSWKLDAYVSNNDWDKCLDVDSELVLKPWSPPPETPLSNIPLSPQNQH